MNTSAPLPAVATRRQTTALFDQRAAAGPMEELGDFTANARMLSISLLAVGIGAISTFVALALLRLIGLFTNLFFFGRWATPLVSPAGNRLGVW